MARHSVRVPNNGEPNVPVNQIQGVFAPWPSSMLSGSPAGSTFGYPQLRARALRAEKCHTPPPMIRIAIARAATSPGESIAPVTASECVAALASAPAAFRAFQGTPRLRRVPLSFLREGTPPVRGSSHRETVHGVGGGTTLHGRPRGSWRKPHEWGSSFSRHRGTLQTQLRAVVPAGLTAMHGNVP
jgi:hypothetical protein